MLELQCVLIETYWNVKQKGEDVTISSLFGINRNILECKVVCQRDPDESCAVLIETYWNVKGNTLQMSPIPHSCINRNILECKDSSIL